MTISGVEPAHRSISVASWGLAVLGLTAALAALSALGADKATAQQHPMAEMTNTVGAIPSPSAAFTINVFKLATGRLKLKGLVATEEDHKALMGLVKASFPSADVTDRVKIANDPKIKTADAAKTDFKLGGISFALKALSFVQSGSAQIDQHGVALSGDAENSAVYAELAKFDAAPPTGIILKEVSVSQPPTSVSWRAEVGGGKVKLTGAVAGSSNKKELEAKLQTLFSGLEIVDETSVVGATSDSWLDAAIHSLQVLRLLDSGFVQLADHNIQLYGHASDEAKLRKIDSLADDYPSGFALDRKVSAPVRASLFDFPSVSAAERSPVTEESIDIQGVAIEAAR